MTAFLFYFFFFVFFCPMFYTTCIMLLMMGFGIDLRRRLDWGFFFFSFLFSFLLCKHALCGVNLFFLFFSSSFLLFLEGRGRLMR